jgi:hypothetical protein
LVLKSCEPTGRDRLIKQLDWSTQSFDGGRQTAMSSRATLMLIDVEQLFL